MEILWHLFKENPFPPWSHCWFIAVQFSPLGAAKFYTLRFWTLFIITCNSKRAHISHACPPRASTACSQHSRDVLSVCVRFSVCLSARLASSSPCQQSVVFLLAGLTLRHVKRATGKKRQVISRFPWTGPQYWECFGRQTVTLPLAPLRLRTPFFPTTDLFLHVTAVKVFHLKAFFPQKIHSSSYYCCYSFFFSFGFCLCIFGYSTNLCVQL